MNGSLLFNQHSPLVQAANNRFNPNYSPFVSAALKLSPNALRAGGSKDSEDGHSRRNLHKTQAHLPDK